MIFQSAIPCSVFFARNKKGATRSTRLCMNSVSCQFSFESVVISHQFLRVNKRIIDGISIEAFLVLSVHYNLRMNFIINYIWLSL